MASENPQNALVVFRGPPRKLLSYEADIELDETYELEIDETLVQFSQPNSVRIRRDISGQLRYLKVLLDRTTPPATV